MNAFVVDLENKPGELARITEAIAAKGIDVTGFAGGTCGDKGTVTVLTNDEAGTRAALNDVRCSFREIEAVAATVANRPGGLARVARQLADAGINIEAALPTGMSGDSATVVFVTSDPAKARSTLGSMMAAGV